MKTRKKIEKSANKGKKRAKAPSHKAAILILITVFLSFFLDKPFVGFMQQARTLYLDTLFGFFTSFLVISTIMLIFPIIILLMKKKAREVFFLSMAFLLSVAIGISLKFIIARPRPFPSTFEFAEPFYYSFPSLHAMVVFALLPFLIKEFPALRRILIGFAAFIGFTRLYFGVHYLSDVIFGAIIGYAIGWYLSHDHILRPGKAQKFLSSHLFEIRRKMMHIALGLLLVLCIQAKFLNAALLGALVAIGFLLSLIERRQKIPLISPLLDIFERSAIRKSFPGKGMLLFFLGSFLSVLLFPQDIAMAAIMALTLGDSLSHLFGVHFGKMTHPLTERKFLEGAIMGFIAVFFGALLFVQAKEALLAAFAAMLIEALEVRVRKLQVDDNLLIPLAAGAAILAMRWVNGIV